MTVRAKRLVCEVTGVLLLLAGAMLLAVGAMPLINPGFYSVMMRSSDSSPWPFVVAALLGVSAVLAGVVLSRKAKQQG